MPSERYVAIPGSDRKPMPDAAPSGPYNPNQQVQLTVVLRPRPLPGEAVPLHELVASGERLSHAAYEATYGADPEDVKRVEAFAQENQLTVAGENLTARTIHLTGTAEACAKAFQVDLAHFEYPDGTYRGRTGPVYVPASLDGIVIGVHGFDNRPQARTHFRIATKNTLGAAAPSVSYTPVQVAKFYQFPPNLNGQGQTIAIIELGGGYRQSDLTAYFRGLGISPAPSVTAVSVDGGQNQPTGDANGPDGEVMLDIEVAGAVAPGAKLVVYFAPNSDAGFLDAINHAATDQQHKPSVISISWGGPESSWTPQSLQSYNSAFQAAAALGVTICVASGDDGSTDGETDGLQHVDFPASSPYALACGGTKLLGAGTTITTEQVWNELPDEGATGGGVSTTFPLPSWQAKAGVPPSANPGGYVGRGAPDVAGDADPATGYQVEVDGSDSIIGGTSAVAPLWAGLIACLNSGLPAPIGYLNPTLYQQIATQAGTFRDITSGNNGDYKAGPGWDACTGWGSPNGTAILQALMGMTTGQGSV
jgi:kumamolisin